VYQASLRSFVDVPRAWAGALPRSLAAPLRIVFVIYTLNIRFYPIYCNLGGLESIFGQLEEALYPCRNFSAFGCRRLALEFPLPFEYALQYDK
jgi:hypothetical protein